MPRLTLSGLTKAYGKLTVVDGVDLTLVEGEFVSLLGPSGCGKTTTLRMIAGFVDPTGGTISVDGNVLSAPGAVTGCMLVFILLMGEYLIPALLGGGKVFFIGNALVDLFLQSRNWPFGSAVAVSLVIIMLVTVTLYLRVTLRNRGMRDQALV